MFRIFLFSIVLLFPSVGMAEQYLSLSKSEAYMRYGPSADHPIKWVYNQKGWPFQVRNRFDQWVKVRDIDGEEGWIHNSLLSARSYALVIPNQEKNYEVVRKKKSSDSSGLIRLESRSLVRVYECQDMACKIGISGYKGYLEKNILWGIVQTQ